MSARVSRRSRDVVMARAAGSSHHGRGLEALLDRALEPFHRPERLLEQEALRLAERGGVDVIVRVAAGGKARELVAKSEAADDLPRVGEVAELLGGERAVRRRGGEAV